MTADTANALKLTITTFCGSLTILWGWFGWLCVALMGCMALDYATGSAAAIRHGEWSSKAARDGLWHKLGAVVAVLVACVLDCLVGLILGNLPNVSLPFDYEVLFAPMVIVWYILTELGSLVENAAALGAPVPPFLVSALAVLKKQVDDSDTPS